MDELKKLLQELMAMLKKLFGEEDKAPLPPPFVGPVQPAPQTVAGVPVGHMAIFPTGVNGKGKVRYWPIPTQGMNYAGYAFNLDGKINPSTGKPYFTEEARGRLGPGMLIGGPTFQLNFAEALDQNCYPEDWYTQAVLDQQRVETEAWGHQNHITPQGKTDARLLLDQDKAWLFLNDPKAYESKIYWGPTQADVARANQDGDVRLRFLDLSGYDPSKVKQLVG